MAKKTSTPATSGPGWAVVLCPLCRGRGVAALITLRGTGDTDDDPVMFPAHGDGECLDQAVTARVVLDAARAAGADTMDDVRNDPAMAAAALRLIRAHEPVEA
ncbi:hypothetical protein [Nocardia wallacei]|uniref:hypothetical protein n=1 Tax=Nocardia wallacei TaxID=480035 RepID=UPI002453D490|nr:hypothetical protein [Nocardia wallacei]